MIPKECKRLAEVDFPIAVVSKHSAREKSIRHGHPSTLHLWWARRPLAACRAILLGLLLPDPCDKRCPEDFKKKARKLLPIVQGQVGPKDEDLRRSLLKFIGDFANWDLSSHPKYLEISRGLIKIAHPEETPLVVDPFAGGGSIPLEALRLGCEAFASDLNPVACLILKVMLEDIPRHGPELAGDLRRVGKEIKKAAEKELSRFYPTDPDGSKPIAYLWARTVRCETPNCGAEIPLMRSFWLCKKENRKRALRYRVISPVGANGHAPSVGFEIFEPKTDKDVPPGTVTRAKATCLCCNTVLSPERVRAQLREQRGGADVIFDKDGGRIGGARLLAVVTLKPNIQGRHYRLPTEQDYRSVWNAVKALERVSKEKLPNGLSPVPDEPTPAGGGSGAGRAFSVQKYGMMTFGDLFTARQKFALIMLLKQIRGIDNTDSIEIITLSLSKLAERLSSLVSWISSTQAPRGTFARQALPIVWDFLEMVPIVDKEEYPELIEAMAKVCEMWSISSPKDGQVQIGDAIQSPLPDQASDIWFTDPPYYDAVPYADLSDFFFVWLKRTLPGHPLLKDLFDQKNPLTPKIKEVVQDETKYVNGRPKDRAFFEDTMAKTFTEGRRVLKEDGVGCVVFAHKTTEGWEALLSGMLKAGWTITASWPIHTERPGRLRAQESAALASSIHLICRPCSKDASVGDWGDILQALPRRIGEWMERLSGEGIRGADLIFSCIGPALEIFSQYTSVETAEGRIVNLPEFLEKVWEVVGRTALEQVLGTAEAQARNTAAGALEEDARLTALFLWTLQSTATENKNAKNDQNIIEEELEDEDAEEEEEKQAKKTGGYSLIFDVVRRFAQPLGIHLPEWEARIIETRKGVVRLLSVRERSKQLFGKEGISEAAERMQKYSSGPIQLALFPDQERAQAKQGAKGKRHTPLSSSEEFTQRREATTLDRVHAAMLLQAGGQTNALRSLLQAEQQRGPDFLRLANALSALYPTGSEEKRLLDAMLLAIPR